MVLSNSYNAGLNEEIQQDIREYYDNSKGFCDGDIYRLLRESQQRQDGRRINRWLVRLSKDKAKCLRSFQKKPELKVVRHALDDLLPYRGLWPALKLGTLHRLLGLKCPEVSQPGRCEKHT